MDKIYYKISITGDLGSGKSTVCKIISEKIGAEVISVGSIQRKMALDMGMTTYEFNKYMETHPEIDNDFDNMLKSYDGVTGKNILFDSRLAWNFVPSAFSVYVTTDLYEAAGRVFRANRQNEEYTGIENAMQKLRERRSSEILRYSAAYGVNIKDYRNYNLIVDSTTATPEEVVNVILGEYKKFVKDKEYHGRFLSPTRLYPLIGAEIGGNLEVIECNDFYFVTGGLNCLKRAITEGMSEIYCDVSNADTDDKAAFIKQNTNVDKLKEWEDKCGFKFFRYPG